MGLLRILAASLALSWAGITLAVAQPGGVMPLLDPAGLPHADAAARGAYQRYLDTNLPRAFALSSKGKTGWHGGTATVEEMRARALKSCADNGGTDCRIYAEDLAIVWPGRAWQASPAPSAPLIGASNHVFVPDARYLWRGPQAAAGIYVWGHGKASGNVTDLRGQQPHPHVRRMNNLGFDIVRFDRDPDGDDVGRAEGWLRQGLSQLRAMGWRKVIVGGQSRGGWNALQMLRHPGLADGIVSVATATHGTSSVGMDRQNREHDELRQMLSGLAQQPTRVVIVQFQDDPFISNPARRLELYEDRVRPKVGALVIIDRPPPFTGHGAGGQHAFGQKFSTCMADVLLAANPPGGC